MMNNEIKMAALNDNELECVVGGFDIEDIDPFTAIDKLAAKDPRAKAVWNWVRRAFGIFTPEE